MQKLRTNLDRILLSLIFITLSASTILWVKSDLTPPPWDPADHISTAYDYYKPITNLDLKAFHGEFFIEPHHYAPFVHLVTAVSFLIFGASKLSAIVVNLLSLGCILLSIQFIYDRTFHKEMTPAETGRLSPATLAALLASCYHFPAWLIHDAFLDYPLIAIVTVSFALLLKTEGFTNRKSSVGLGIALGLGLLTKQTFAFFLILPVAYASYKAIRSLKITSILNLFIAGFVAATLAAIWYIPHLQDVLEIYRINKEGAINENEAPLLSFMSNVFYLHSLASAQLQVPFAALFIAGLTYSLVRLRRESLLLYLWILSGIATFTMVANKDIRYTVPILPAVAIISVCWLSHSIRQNRKSTKILLNIRRSAVIAIAAWSFVTFFNAQWPRSGMGYYIDTPNFRWMVFARNYYGFDHRPLGHDWSIPQIVQTVTNISRTEMPDREPILATTVNLPYFNPSVLTLYSRLMTPDRAGPPLMKIDALTSDNEQDRVRNCQYLLIRTGLESAEWKAPLESYAEEFIRQNPDRYRKIASFPIPLPNAEAVLYKCGDFSRPDHSEAESRMSNPPIKLFTR